MAHLRAERAKTTLIRHKKTTAWHLKCCPNVGFYVFALPTAPFKQQRDNSGSISVCFQLLLGWIHFNQEQPWKKKQAEHNNNNSTSYLTVALPLLTSTVRSVYRLWHHDVTNTQFKGNLLKSVFEAFLKVLAHVCILGLNLSILRLISCVCCLFFRCDSTAGKLFELFVHFYLFVSLRVLSEARWRDVMQSSLTKRGDC